MATMEEPLAFGEAVEWLLTSEAMEHPTRPTNTFPSLPHIGDGDSPMAPPHATADDDCFFLSSSKSTGSRTAKKLHLKHVKALLCISRAEGHRPLSSLLSLVPTSAVYIHGAGASCGMKYDDVHSAFSSFGRLLSLTMAGILPFVLAVYESVDAAVSCRRCHHRQKHPSVCDGRLLFVDYANLAQSSLLEDSAALLLPNASSTSFPAVPGLAVLTEFVSEEEERALLGFLNAQPWLPHKFRSVQHYGYVFDYERNDVFDDRRPHSDLHMFPPAFHALIHRFRHLPSLPSVSPHAPSDCRETEFVPDQLTVNRYLPGDGIPAHVDVHSSFTSFVLSLSLASAITMDIAPFPSSPSVTAPASFPLLLPRRSLLVLGHYARFGCQHAIQPRKTDRVDGRLVERTERVSLTFRRRREGGQCDCSWPALCDTASGVRKKEKKFIPVVHGDNDTGAERLPREESKEAGGADSHG